MRRWRVLTRRFGQASGFSKLGGRLPDSAAARFLLASMAIAVRVARVALPICGTRATLSTPGTRIEFRLAFEHIQARRRDAPFLERLDERSIIDDPAASGN